MNKERKRYNKFKPRRFRSLNVNSQFVDGESVNGYIIEVQDHVMVLQTKDNNKMLMNKSAMKFVTQRIVKKKKNMEQDKTFTIRRRSN